MKLTRRAITAILLIIICMLIHLYSAGAARVENGYSTHFYIFMAAFLRHCFGWLPFSIGDILYLSALVWIVLKIIRLVRLLFRRKPGIPLKERAGNKLLKAIILLCSIYIIFNIFWGINYNRVGISNQIGLNQQERYTAEDLRQINALLVEKINSSKQSLLLQNKAYPSNKELFKGVEDAYAQLATQYPYLQYKTTSLKTSMWGWVGNYTGFSGYYNPFTGEAQVNTTMPKFLLPYTACHEVAHQLGYAKEMEANFVGYLAAAASTDTLFHYSVYLDLFNYANRNLFYKDTSAAVAYRKQLSPAVVKDIKEWVDFSRRHSNPLEPFIRWGYGKFLLSNQQPHGMMSYDEVTGFIIAYYKKNGKI